MKKIPRLMTISFLLIGVIFICGCKKKEIKIDIQDVLYVGTQIQLKATVTPNSNEEISWSVDNTSICKIENGTLYCLEPGEVLITAFLKNDPSVQDKKTVQIIANLDNISGNKELLVGESINWVLPNGCTLYTTDDCITISNNKITGVKVGEATVTAKSATEEKTFTVTVEELSVVVASSLVVGTTSSYAVLPSRYESIITVSSSDTSVVSIKDKEISALQKGEVTITFSIPNSDILIEKKLTVYGDNSGIEEKMEAAFQSLDIKDEGSKTTFPEEISYLDMNFSLIWSFDEAMFDGIYIVRDEEEEITYEMQVIFSAESFNKAFTYKFTARSGNDLYQELINKITFPEEIDDDLVLVSPNEDFTIQLSSRNKYVLSDEGVLRYVSENTPVTVMVTFIYGEGSKDELFYDEVINIIAKPYNEEKAIKMNLDSFSLPDEITTNFQLPVTFSYNIKGYWESNKPEIINTLGHVSLNTQANEVLLTLHLYRDDIEKATPETYSVITKAISLTEGQVYFGQHNLTDKVKETKFSKMENVQLVDDRIELSSGQTTGYYQSLEYVTSDVARITGSWAAITSVDANIELKIRVKANGVWSKYFTYGKWGLGAPNLYYNQSDSNASMSVDEIIAGNKPIEAFQYQMYLYRTNASSASPKVLAVTVALRINNYYYGVDTSSLPTQVDYDVPKLNQNEVPGIGSVICSATTTTMLLKYHGKDFTEYDSQYEHRYIASLVKDEGHNSPTYGNWTFNMAVAGAYGFDASVQRMYSWEELKYHLATTGPVGCSIAGNFGLYTTGGHLIVVRGYREENGQTYVITNDPNVNTRFGAQYYVYYEVTLEMFMNVWGGIAYVVK